ncbi:flavin reductase family protein [Jatrophihabitans lederbergiae]|uniref:Flavin reductase family protein n=1 Tax=Jatrophihabitans lederbergiae TaxID=3075547 RepID=A0ABU2JE38_9ACTN|nr:flavin reductase family protein [Jatrophihabitans sp. DSM 44399]MDT0263235.1 flavin reductase family protein [Jatrophihabitans sp. DSM 44399]
MTAPQAVPVGRQLRSTLGCFATGITVVATGGQQPHGMTANSFTSVSIEPPLVLVCVRVDAVFHESLRAFGSYSVNVLSAAQEEVARHFANPARHAVGNEFPLGNWSTSEQTGALLLRDSHAWLDCRLEQVYDGGDHSIFLGRVLDFGADIAAEPLLYYEGEYHNLSRSQFTVPHRDSGARRTADALRSASVPT